MTTRILTYAPTELIARQIRLAIIWHFDGKSLSTNVAVESDVSPKGFQVVVSNVSERQFNRMKDFADGVKSGWLRNNSYDGNSQK